MAQEEKNGAVLYRLQWSNGKVRKERYYYHMLTALDAYLLIADALPSEDWCRLSEMYEDGLNGYVEKSVIKYSEE